MKSHKIIHSTWDFTERENMSTKKLETSKSLKFEGRSLVKTTARIGEIVRQVRKASKLTQKEAAGLCNVGPRFLSDLENGKASLQLAKVLQVLRAFGLLVILEKKSLAND
jgi:y4mF family transcriptional regulator